MSIISPEVVFDYDRVETDQQLLFLAGELVRSELGNTAGSEEANKALQLLKGYLRNLKNVHYEGMPEEDLARQIDLYSGVAERGLQVIVAGD